MNIRIRPTCKRCVAVCVAKFFAVFVTVFVTACVAMCCSDTQYEAHQIYLGLGLFLACKAESVMQCVAGCCSALCWASRSASYEDN